MDAQQLTNFFAEHETEIDWRGDKLMAWIHPYDLRDFCDLIGYEYLSDGGYPAHIMFNGTVCLELNGLCEDFEIDPEQILPREKGANTSVPEQESDVELVREGDGNDYEHPHLLKGEWQ